MGKYFPPGSRPGRSFGVDCNHDALGSESSGRILNQLWILHRRRIDADFVGAGIEQTAHIAHFAHATANRQGNKNLRGHLLDYVKQQTSIVGACSDIQKGDFIGALLIVFPRNFDRIPSVSQGDEIDALHDTSISDIEAGNNSLGKTHGGHFSTGRKKMDRLSDGGAGLRYGFASADFVLALAILSASFCASAKSSVPS